MKAIPPLFLAAFLLIGSSAKAQEADGITIGGRIQSDWVSAHGNEDVSGTEFRRARLFAAGDIADDVFFKAQYDLAGGDADFKDVYIGFRNIGPGTLKVGHFKEPFSLEELTSSKYITFMERSLPNGFAPARNVGMMLYGSGEAHTWAFGAFHDTDGYGTASGNDAEPALTARLTFLPWYADKGANLLHLGVSASHRGSDLYNLGSEPETHMLADWVVSGDILAEGSTLLGAEALLVQGPLWAMAEIIQASLDAPASSNPTLSGYTLQAGYFLTGEHKAYKASSATLNRQKAMGESGAWELKARMSHLDLTEGPGGAPELDGLSLGVNYWMNSHTRIMLDWIQPDMDGAIDTDIVMLRFQVDF